jgi:hypothetical protein
MVNGGAVLDAFATLCGSGVERSDVDGAAVAPEQLVRIRLIGHATATRASVTALTLRGGIDRRPRGGRA